MSLRDIIYSVHENTKSSLENSIVLSSKCRTHIKNIMDSANNIRTCDERLDILDSLVFLRVYSKDESKNLEKIIDDLLLFEDLQKKQLASDYDFAAEKFTEQDHEVYSSLRDIHLKAEKDLLTAYKKYMQVIETYAKTDKNQLVVYLGELELAVNERFLKLVNDTNYYEITNLEQWQKFVKTINQFTFSSTKLKKICNLIKPKNSDTKSSNKEINEKAYQLISALILNLSESERKELFNDQRQRGRSGAKSKIAQLIKNSENSKLFHNRRKLTSDWDNVFFSNIWDKVRADLKSDFNNTIN